MNRKGFTLIEMLGCMVLLGIVLGIGLYLTKDTLSTSLSMINDVSINQIRDASELYVKEYKTSWVNNDKEESACISVLELVDAGYFSSKEVSKYLNDYVMITREPRSRVIDSVQIMDKCE